MRKKYLFTVVAAMFLLVVPAASQSKQGLIGEPVKNELLVEILNSAEMKEITVTDPNYQTYFLRLYSIGEIGTCAPDVETEVTCSFRYYLAVHDGSLGVSGAVYFLGEVGEIRSIKRLEKDHNEPARLLVEVGSFPDSVFPYNKKLTLKVTRYEIDVDMMSIKVKPVK